MYDNMVSSSSENFLHANFSQFPWRFFAFLSKNVGFHKWIFTNPALCNKSTTSELKLKPEPCYRHCPVAFVGFCILRLVEFGFSNFSR